jgi:hypothetical protein
MKMKQIKKLAHDFCVGEYLDYYQAKLIHRFVSNLKNENDLIKYLKASEPMPEPPAEINIIGL